LSVPNSYTYGLDNEQSAQVKIGHRVVV